MSYLGPGQIVRQLEISWTLFKDQVTAPSVRFSPTADIPSKRLACQNCGGSFLNSAGDLDGLASNHPHLGLTILV